MRKILTESGNEIIVINKLALYNQQQMEYINEGEEGITYRYQENAIKIYHETPRKKVANKKILKHLQEQEIKRIIRPIELLSEENRECSGYIAPYINGNNEEIYHYSKNKLLEEITTVTEDLKILGNQGIAIGDLRSSNYLSNQSGVYLLDFGDYYESKENTTSINNRTFELFFLYSIIYEKLKKIGKKEAMSDDKVLGVYRKLRYQVISQEQSLLPYLEENMYPHETLAIYTKRLIHK